MQGQNTSTPSTSSTTRTPHISISARAESVQNHRPWSRLNFSMPLELNQNDLQIAFQDRLDLQEAIQRAAVGPYIELFNEISQHVIDQWKIPGNPQIPSISNTTHNAEETTTPTQDIKEAYNIFGRAIDALSFAQERTKKKFKAEDRMNEYPLVRESYNNQPTSWISVFDGMVETLALAERIKELQE